MGPPEAQRSEALSNGETERDLLGSPAAGPTALRGSAMRSAAYISSVLLSLISVPLLIRHLGIARFGRYSAVIALVSVAGGLSDAGLLTIAMREWTTRIGRDRSNVMRQLLGIRVELGAATVIAAVTFAWIAGYSHLLVLGTLIASIGMVLQITADLLTSPLQGDLRFGWASAIDVARQTIFVLCLAALILAGAGLLPLLAATIASGGTSLMIAATLARRSMSITPVFRGRERWTLIRETIPYAAAIALNTFYFRVTTIVMFLIASARQTGYFATSFRVTEVLTGIPALAVGAAFPILARTAGSDHKRFGYVVGRVLELALVAGVGMVLLVVLSAPFVITLLAGSRGSAAVPVLQIQALGLVASFVSVASGYALLALRHQRALLIANAAALVANVVLTLILVPVDQARGAAIAAVAAETCLAFGQTTMLLRRHGGLRVAPVVAVAVAGTIGAAPLLIDVHPLIRTVCGLTAYIAVLALFRQIPPELGHALNRHGFESR